MKNASLYKMVGRKAVCMLCCQRCVIKPGRLGKCGVRENRDGALYSRVYGKVSAEQIDPVEKKPLFHFMPGSLTYSLATVGCNFRCLHCQNHSISQVNPGKNQVFSQLRGPAEVAETALRNNCRSVSYTYVEPTIFFEFAYDCCLEVRKLDLKNVFVSNGYMSPEAAEMLAPVLDGINIDIKAFSDSFYRDVCGVDAGLGPVLDNVRFFQEQGVWVEATTLLIPGLNDSDREITEIAEFIAETGKDIPWHVSAFRPSYKMCDRSSTPPERLMRAREAGLACGLKHVYVGNVHSGNGEDTICPNCGKVLIRRVGFKIFENILSSGSCPECGTEIAGLW